MEAKHLLFPLVLVIEIIWGGMTYARPCSVWVAEAYPCRWTVGSEGTRGKITVEPQHAPFRRGNTSIKQHFFEFGVRIGLEISSGIQ